MTRQEITFEEAQETDAQAFIIFMDQVIGETDFLVADEEGFSYSLEETQEILRRSSEREDSLCLLAKLDSSIIGLVSVKAEKPYPISHIGDIFIAVLKDYWNHGIGRILMEEACFWAKEIGVLKRLELTVQARNQRAVRLYQSCGFEIEGTKKRGARTNEGEWLDLYYMGKLID